MTANEERALQADAEAARAELLRAYEDKRYTLAELRATFFDNDLAMGTLQAKLNGHAPIAGSNQRTIRLFAAALKKIQAINCDECGLYKEIARRSVGADDEKSIPRLAQDYFGNYDLYTRYVFSNFKSQPEDKTSSINIYKMVLHHCENCGYPKFRIEVKNEYGEAVSRSGFVFLRSTRIHLMIIGKDQFTHMQLRGHTMLDEGPLPGIVLYDRESNEGHTMYACRVALVKEGSGFADDISGDEWNRMDYFLRNDSVPRQDGVLGAYHYARED